MQKKLISFLCQGLMLNAFIAPTFAGDKAPEPKIDLKDKKENEKSSESSEPKENEKKERPHPVRFDPFSESAEEDIKIFMDLAKREEELSKRENLIKKEALLLKAAEKSLDEKLKEFQFLKADLDKLLKRLDDRESVQNKDLVKMYETMKPKQAAAIVNKIELALAIQLFKQMNKKKAALILAATDSKRAKDITQGLAKESYNLALVK